MIPKSLNFRKMFDAALVPAVVVFVGLGAFGLGRLSAIGDGQLPEAPSAETASSGTASPGPIVASKTGTKYYLATCSGAKNIKDANKVYFANAAEAQAAGYTAVANCPGLQ